MLGKINRFHGRVSLLRVFRRGRVTRSRRLSVRFAPSPNGHMRAAIVVGKKVHKSAVVRNRIRRRIYAFTAEQKTNLLPGDYVFTVFDASLADVAPSDLLAELTQLLSRAELLTKT